MKPSIVISFIILLGLLAVQAGTVSTTVFGTAMDSDTTYSIGHVSQAYGQPTNGSNSQPSDSSTNSSDEETFSGLIKGLTYLGFVCLIVIVCVVSVCCRRMFVCVFVFV